MPQQYVPDADWEAQGRKLMHVYPATNGPHNPNLGHSVGMAGGQNSFNVASHNYDRLEEGMVFVLHTQWLEAAVGRLQYRRPLPDHVGRFRKPQPPHAARDAPGGRLTG